MPIMSLTPSDFVSVDLVAADGFGGGRDEDAGLEDNEAEEAELEDASEEESGSEGSEEEESESEGEDEEDVSESEDEEEQETEFQKEVRASDRPQPRSPPIASSEAVLLTPAP